MSVQSSARIAALQDVATRLRIDSVRATSEAGNGHPTTCASAADLVAALFFAHMHFDPTRPQHADNDRFVLSKGHAAPLLYAAWAELGLFPREDLLTLRRLSSDLEGHPTPRLAFVDVATGSLGQGLAAGIGIALNARRIGSAYRTYVLMGDGESAEGAVWEAAESGRFHALDNLCAITDVNALGQSRETQYGHDMESFAARWRAFGWHTIVIDGHDVEAILAALAEAEHTAGRPTMILARTLKGKGIPLAEGKGGWHGRPFKKGAEEDGVLKALEAQLRPDAGPLPAVAGPRSESRPVPAAGPSPAPAYALGDSIATREAYGEALAAIGATDARIVVLDADVGNSTYSEKFEAAHKDRFYEFYIAEQVMIGAAMGLAARGAIPFPSTFAAFLTRAYDFIRMACISGLNIKLAGSHVGVSIGEDGPSQMALEDIAMMRAEPNMTVVYPCDATSTHRLIEALVTEHGPGYMRTSRPKTPVIYGPDEAFPIGGCKVLRQSAHDVATVVAAGVTVFEALEAHRQLEARGVGIRVIDLYSVQPIDRATLVASGKTTRNRIVTVEDHYAAGGVGEAVTAAVGGDLIRVERLAVREIPRSGKPEELLDRYGISARHIVAAVMRP